MAGLKGVIAQSAVAVFSQRHTGNGGGGGDKPRRRRRQTNADDNAAQYGATVIIAAGRPVAGKQTSFLAKERRDYGDAHLPQHSVAVKKSVDRRRRKHGCDRHPH